MPSYLTSSDADTIAAALPGLASYKGATDDAKTAAIELASERVDEAYRYQGRRYQPEECQPLEFPRVAYESGRQGLHSRVGAYDVNATYVPSQIWDWDSTNNVAVVPARILRAVVYEADSILSGARDERLQTQHDGVTSQSIGSASESYRPGTPPVLCLDADRCLQRYRLKQGRLL